MQDPNKEKVPIVWKGKAKEDATSSKAAAALDATETQPPPEPKPLQRMKPNAAFLLNVVADAQRGNERLCAEDATNASLTVLGQAVSAGIRPQLDRTQEAGPSTVRAAVLSVAQQQKLATCTALLREVAMVYGFALHADPVTWARRLLPLHIRLNLASQEDHAALADAVTAPHAYARPLPELQSVPRAPAIDVRANRLAGTALGAIGLPGATAPPLAVRKLLRAKARQKDRAGIFAASDATPADSSQGEDGAEVMDVELAEEDYVVSARQFSSSLPGAAVVPAQAKVWPRDRAGRPASAPIHIQNGHRSVSSARSEASSVDEQPDVAPSRLPRPRAARAGPAQGLPNGQPSGRLSRLPRNEANDTDAEVDHGGSPEPAPKRLRAAAHDRAAAHAWNPAIQDGMAQKGSRAPSGERAALKGRTLADLPDRSESDGAEGLEASDEGAPQQQPAQPVRMGMRADTAKANGEAGSLRSRLGSSMAYQGVPAAQRVLSEGLKPGQGKQEAMKKGVKSSRGLFGAALTSLQR